MAGFEVATEVPQPSYAPVLCHDLPFPATSPWSDPGGVNADIPFDRDLAAMRVDHQFTLADRA